MIFWNLFLRESGSEQPLRELLGYFLISGSFADLIMLTRPKLGQHLHQGIKGGKITFNILRPVKLLTISYAEVWGSYSERFVPGMILILSGIVLIGPTPIGLIGFMMFVPLAFTIGLVMNVLQGALTFYLTEPTGIISALVHLTRLMSGLLIPLYYFPESLELFARYLPFSMAVFAPIDALTLESFDVEFITIWAVGVLWSVILFLTVYYLWRQGLKRYEAVGI